MIGRKYGVKVPGAKLRDLKALATVLRSRKTINVCCAKQNLAVGKKGIKSISSEWLSTLREPRHFSLI